MFFIFIVYVVLGFLLISSTHEKIKRKKVHLVVGYVLLPVFYFWAAATMPAIYNRQGRITYKNYIKKTLGRNVVRVRGLECYCLDCKPTNDDLNVYCLFGATPDNMENIALDLGLEKKKVSRPGISILSLVKLCGDRSAFTHTYEKKGYGNGEGIPAVFYYNEDTQDACVKGWFPSK